MRCHIVSNMKIDFFSNSAFRELAQSGVVSWEDRQIAPTGSTGEIGHTIVSYDHSLQLIVDHSHFTAHQSEFRIRGDDRQSVADLVLRSVEASIIALQSRTITKLGSVNAAVINSLDDNEIVHNVLREVMNVLPHSDAGVFRLFDEKTGLLIPVSYDGLPEDYAHYRLQPNESVSGEVFSTGQPAIHNGRQNIIDAHRVMRPESQSFMERSNIANALLCVPVMAEGRRLGTLTTLSFSPDGAFSLFDQTILELLASQVAVAYQRSLTYQNTLAASRRLEQMRSDLADKNRELDRAVDLHESLLRIFSTGSSQSEQLEAVSRLYHAEFIFENVLGQDHRSSGWNEDGDVVRQAVEVAEVSVGHFRYDGSVDTAFRRALFGTLAAFVALDFVRDMSRIDAMNVRKKAYFDTLFSAGDTRDRRANYGFRPDRFNQIFVALTPGGEATANASLTRQKTILDLQKVMTLPNALIFHEDDEIVVLVSAPTSAALERNRQVMAEAISRLDIRVGASNPYEEAASHQQARAKAKQAAEALQRRGKAGLLQHAQMGLDLLLGGQGRDEVLDFATQVLQPLLQDPKHLVLFETFAHYMLAGKSPAKTADALSIHPNTLYQRLAKVEKLTGRDLDDAADYTLLCVASQLYRTYTSGKPDG
ncbi:GAF domain-containing protein [Rhizobium sp. Td3]|nr:GAF domain-containing protein [Rhizobium sp. Td3]